MSYPKAPESQEHRDLAVRHLAVVQQVAALTSERDRAVVVAGKYRDESGSAIDYDRMLVESRAEVARLIAANEHWHIRVDQLIQTIDKAASDREAEQAVIVGNLTIFGEIMGECAEALERAASNGDAEAGKLLVRVTQFVERLVKLTEGP